MLQRYSKYGIDFKVRRDECTAIAKLDAQAEAKKSCFGGGLLLSERKAAEKAAAEKWELSKRELKLIEELGRKAKR